MKKKEIQKRYFRFLKELGVFKRCMEIHQKGTSKKISEVLESYDPFFWIQSATTFCTWCKTPENDIFWWAISILWEYEYHSLILDSDKTYYKKDDIVRHIREYLSFYNTHKEKSTISNECIEKLKKELNNKLKEISK